MEILLLSILLLSILSNGTKSDEVSDSIGTFFMGLIMGIFYTVRFITWPIWFPIFHFIIKNTHGWKIENDPEYIIEYQNKITKALIEQSKPSIELMEQVIKDRTV